MRKRERTHGERTLCPEHFPFGLHKLVCTTLLPGHTRTETVTSLRGPVAILGALAEFAKHMELVKSMEERWAAEERWALRQIGFIDELQELRLLCKADRRLTGAPWCKADRRLTNGATCAASGRTR